MKPVLSRSCNVERVLNMSLGNWEGKMSSEAEPEELPNFSLVANKSYCERRYGEEYV